MSRHLILTVHGIGEQKPGETVDAIVGAATTSHDSLDREDVKAEWDLIRLSEDTFTKPKSTDLKEREARLFPVHIRRVKPISRQDEAIFAEVYWADKSPAPTGPLNTVIDLLSVVLGLGYIAMDNVENTRGWFQRGLVHLFTWVFYGVVAPLNAMLAIGAFLLLLDLTPLQIVGHESAGVGDDEIAFPILLLFALHGIVTLGSGAYILAAKARTYLIRLFGIGLSIFGLGILILAAIGLFGSYSPGQCILDEVKNSGRGCLENLEIFISASIFVLQIAWTCVLTLTLLNFIFVPFGKLASRQTVPPPRAIYPSICAAMVIFWLIFSASIWLGFVELVQQFAPNGELGGQDGAAEHNSILRASMEARVVEALSTLSVTFVGLLLIVAVSIVLFAIRRCFQDVLFKLPDNLSRVILNVWLEWVFFLSLVLILLFVAGNTYVSCAAESRDIKDGFCEFLQGNLPGYQMLGELKEPVLYLSDKKSLVLPILLGLFLFIYNFSNFVSAGLGVFRDIVTYAVVNKCKWLAAPEDRVDNFIDRKAINARFLRVMDYGIRAFDPDYISVISHSQGTVIAVQNLKKPELKDLLQDHLDAKATQAQTGLNPQKKANLNKPKLRLITMGSPVTHIYARYFAQMFEVRKSDMPNGIIWHNIYRTDDFVGTRIDTADHAAINMPVPAAGHTGYFTDYHVWKKIWANAKFELFPDSDPTTRAVRRF